MKKKAKKIVKKKVVRKAVKAKAKVLQDISTPMKDLTFGAAISLMKAGKKMARAGWNGKGMWCIYVPGTKKAKLSKGTPYANAMPKRKTIDILPHFDMYTVNSSGRKAMLPGWLASQSDMDSTDWGVVK